MAVSFLRIGRAGSLKKWLESRGSLTSAPFAALCTKPGDPKKPAKQTSTKITYPVRDWVMQSFPQEAAAQVDPIQKLFIDKIREYSSKSKSAGVLVDTGPEYERNLAEEINRLQRLYGGGDLTKFPDFKFPEPKLEEVSTK